ncbi:Uncharacterised protein [Mycobacteroides abscessus subsp. abscessus]|nr:Uncharacterised protein [Mycobacteroides abscessus subsp. abscessus]
MPSEEAWLRSPTDMVPSTSYSAATAVKASTSYGAISVLPGCWVFTYPKNTVAGVVVWQRPSPSWKSLRPMDSHC